MPENTDDIKNFDYEAFAKDLSSQVDSVIPPDISPEDKDYITSVIYRMCKMAGEALVKAKESKLTAQQAALVVQIIGEWLFHKSIDSMRAGIAPQYRDGILQKVAFTVFDITQKAIEKQIPQEQLIELVEVHVKKSYKMALEELKANGIISSEVTDNALHQSNIDAMAQEQVEDETNTEIACMADEKKMKIASLAILMRNFSSDKMRAILQQLNKPERDLLIGYLKDPQLEENIDADAALKCFEEMKNALPEVIVISLERAWKKMYKIVKKLSYEQISDIIKNERPLVRDFVMSCYNKKTVKLPARVADVVAKYLEEKVS